MKKKLLLAVLILLIAVNIGISLYPHFSRSNSSFWQEKSFFCPVPAKYCDTAKKIEFEDQYWGIGFSLPPGTRIYSLFGGQARGGKLMLAPKLGGDRYPTILLEDFGKGLSATYILTGNGFPGLKNVSQGEEITVAGEDKIGNLGFNLVVQLRREENGEEKFWDIGSSSKQ